MQETITIPKKEYFNLKKQANIDMDFLRELVQSLSEIKCGKARQVR